MKELFQAVKPVQLVPIQHLVVIVQCHFDLNSLIWEKIIKEVQFRVIDVFNKNFSTALQNVHFLKPNTFTHIVLLCINLLIRRSVVGYMLSNSIYGGTSITTFSPMDLLSQKLVLTQQSKCYQDEDTTFCQVSRELFGF